MVEYRRQSQNESIYVQPDWVFFSFVVRERRRWGTNQSTPRGCLFDLRLKIERLRALSARAPTFSSGFPRKKARDRDKFRRFLNASRHGFKCQLIMYSKYKTIYAKDIKNARKNHPNEAPKLNHTRTLLGLRHNRIDPRPNRALQHVLPPFFLFRDHDRGKHISFEQPVALAWLGRCKRGAMEMSRRVAGFLVCWYDVDYVA